MSKSGGQDGTDGILNVAFYDGLWVLSVSLAASLALAFLVEPVRENYAIVLFMPLLLFFGEFVFRICYDLYVR